MSAASCQQSVAQCAAPGGSDVGDNVKAIITTFASPVVNPSSFKLVLEDDDNIDHKRLISQSACDSQDNDQPSSTVSNEDGFEPLLDDEAHWETKKGGWCTTTVMLWVTVAVALTACLILALKPGLITPVLLRILNWVKSLGYWGPIALTAIIIVSIPLCIPTTLFNVGGGFLFGWRFLPLLSFAATSGATIAYFLSRGLLKGVAERKLKKNKFFQSIRKIFIADDGRFTWRSTKAVLLTRASPFFPFVIINFANGVTGVSWKSYVLATWIGTFPWVSVDIYFGTLLEDLTSVGNQHKSGLFLIILVIFTVLITIVITVVTKRELKRMERALYGNTNNSDVVTDVNVEMHGISGTGGDTGTDADDMSDVESCSSSDRLVNATTV